MIWCAKQSTLRWICKSDVKCTDEHTNTTSYQSVRDFIAIWVESVKDVAGYGLTTCGLHAHPERILCP